MNFCRDDDGVFIHPERVLQGNPCRHHGEAPRAAASFNQTVERMAGPPRRLAICELLEGPPSLTISLGSRSAG